jgi:general secretion pathway protein J
MRSTERGFTLLELLIAVSLLVLLMAMLLGGLHIATHNLGRQSEQLDRASRTVLAQSFMRAQLGDARPFTTTGAAGGAIAFDGRADGLDFVGVVPEAAATGGLQVLSLGVSDTRRDEGLELLVGWRPFTGAASAAVAPSHRSVLLDHIQEAAFAYFGAANPDEPPSWHSSWRNMTYLPSLVRLSLIFSDGERMPEFVAALHMSSGAAGIAAAQ